LISTKAKANFIVTCTITVIITKVRFSEPSIYLLDCRWYQKSYAGDNGPVM